MVPLSENDLISETVKRHVINHLSGYSVLLKNGEGINYEIETSQYEIIQ